MKGFDYFVSESDADADADADAAPVSARTDSTMIDTM